MLYFLLLRNDILVFCQQLENHLMILLLCLSKLDLHIRRNNILLRCFHLWPNWKILISQKFHKFSNLMISKRKRKTTKINLVILSCIFHRVFFVKVLLLEKCFRFDHFKCCTSLNISELFMCSKEVFDPSRSHSQNGKCSSLIKSNIGNWWWMS